MSIENKKKLILAFQGNAISKIIGRNRDPESILDSLASFDPTKNAKYLQWLVNQFVNRKLIEEDFYKMKDLLTLFEQKKKFLSESNIHCYDVHSLEDALSPFVKIEFGDFKPAGSYRVLLNSKEEDFFVVELLDKEAAVAFGAGTNWCTAAKEHNAFDNYKDGLMVLIHNKRKWQFHFKSSQFMDEKDRSISKKDISLLSKIPSYKAWLNDMCIKYYSPLEKYL